MQSPEQDGGYRNTGCMCQSVHARQKKEPGRNAIAATNGIFRTLPIFRSSYSYEDSTSPQKSTAIIHASICVSGFADGGKNTGVVLGTNERRSQEM